MAGPGRFASSPSGTTITRQAARWQCSATAASPTSAATAWRDLEHDVPITPRRVFYVGSVSKQFTAFAAALAIQQGKLSLDDDVRKYLPELPPYADRGSRCGTCFHHTSGLRDYNTLLSIAGRRDDDAFDNATSCASSARQKALNFKPGDEYLYSNTGYALLALIVERATGTPFATFADARIFKPLGMSDTQFLRRCSTAGEASRARATTDASGEWRSTRRIHERTGAGGVFTTMRDLLRVGRATSTRAKVGGAALIDSCRRRARSTTARPDLRVGPADRRVPRPAASSSTAARSAATART